MFQQIIDEEHEVGSHTRNHAMLTKISAEEVENELKASAADLPKLWGIVPSTMYHLTSKQNATINSRYSVDIDKDSTINYTLVKEKLSRLRAESMKYLSNFSI